MNRHTLPVTLAVLLVVSLTLVEASISDRWQDTNIDPAEFDALFAQVPKELEGWEGVDLPVADLVKKTAGAVSYVSRRYTHMTTGRKVTIWLIVGHSRDICRHTPNICRPSSGYTQQGGQLKHRIELEDQKPALFHTAKFEKQDVFGRSIERVFWAWNRPDLKLWEAPDSARLHYGNSRALYKLYFTSDVMSDEATVDKNVAIKFAELMLPKINAALFPEEESPKETLKETSTEETPEG